MLPHPDFAGIDFPRSLVLGQVRFTPLSPEYVDEDFDAVMASAPLLARVFGSWPEGLTREDNLIDLAWHEREFTSRRSFSWILRAGAGTYIGCFYIYPGIGHRGRAQVVLWLCDIDQRDQIAARLKTDILEWLAGTVPEGIVIDWLSSPAV